VNDGRGDVSADPGVRGSPGVRLIGVDRHALAAAPWPGRRPSRLRTRPGRPAGSAATTTGSSGRRRGQ
jgi:hypothetical protein